MNRRLMGAAAILASGMLSTCALAEKRVWTSLDGRYRRVAEFVRSDGEVVQLRIFYEHVEDLKDIPLAKLSEADQTYVAGKPKTPFDGGFDIERFFEPPPSKIEGYLQSGNLANGQLELEAELARTPEDDALRFALGTIQFMCGVERLGQSLHRYGVKSEATKVPILRLPVPRNADPDPVDYLKLRRVLDDFRRDLLIAEATLAPIDDVNVELPLRLAKIRLDLDGDGEPTEEFLVCMKRFVGTSFPVLEENPELRVRFDRGDVAWFRAYCHLLAAFLDGYLAFDGEREFELFAGSLFAEPTSRFESKLTTSSPSITLPWALHVKERARLDRARRHLISVAQLNREAWAHIRLETDNDYEWLPNPKQDGTLEHSITASKIDEWLKSMGELEQTLDGRRALFTSFSKNGKGLNLKAALESPPAEFEIHGPDSMHEYLDRMTT